MTAPPQTTGSAAEAHPEALTQGVSAKEIQGRSLGQIAWMRLKRDRVALAGGVIIVVLILLAITALLLDRVFGVLEPNRFYQSLIDGSTQAPLGTFGGMSAAHPLGVEPVNGRDILTRIFVGSWISLLIAVGATLLSVFIGTTMGLLAGFFGGWVDSVIARIMDMLPGVPAAGLRLRDGGRHPGRGVRPVRGPAPHPAADLHHRLLQLALHRPHRARADAVAARARVRRRRAQPGREERGGSWSRSCCPTWSRRSSSTPRC